MHITVAQYNYHIGNFKENLSKIKKVLNETGSSSNMIVFSELCLTGYYPYDLMDRASFIEAQEKALEEIKSLSKAYNCLIVIGAITQKLNKEMHFHNSAVVLHQGKIIYQYHKQLLPVYNIFDEARHFLPGGEQPLFVWQGKRIGFLICEDAWGSFKELYRTDPIQSLKKQNPDLTVVLNASPSNIGKWDDRLAHMRHAAQTLNTPLIYVNQVGGNDDMVYDGQSFVLDPQGQLLGCLKAFEEGHAGLKVDKKVECDAAWQSWHAMSDEALLYEHIRLGLGDYIRKSGFKGVVIGLSGGIDSAVTAAIAVSTLGPEKVKTIYMPTRFTSQQSLEGATELSLNLGIEMFHYPLDQSYEQALRDFEKVFGEKPSDITSQNIQARLRGRILMEYSNHTGYMVLSTGNKSEISVGYTTIYGDMTGGFNLIGDIYKQQVYALARFYNKSNPQALIPEFIITREPSAELKAGQKDSDTLPPYAQLDPLLKYYIEGDLLPDEEKQACLQVLKALPKETTKKVYQMVDKAEFKRRQSAPIVRCQRRSFGWGRRMPISAYYENI